MAKQSDAGASGGGGTGAAGAGGGQATGDGGRGGGSGADASDAPRARDAAAYCSSTDAGVAAACAPTYDQQVARARCASGYTGRCGSRLVYGETVVFDPGLLCYYDDSSKALVGYSYQSDTGGPGGCLATVAGIPGSEACGPLLGRDVTDRQEACLPDAGAADASNCRVPDSVGTAACAPTFDQQVAAARARCPGSSRATTVACGSYLAYAEPFFASPGTVCYYDATTKGYVAYSYTSDTSGPDGCSTQTAGAPLSADGGAACGAFSPGVRTPVCPTDGGASD